MVVGLSRQFERGGGPGREHDLCQFSVRRKRLYVIAVAGTSKFHGWTAQRHSHVTGVPAAERGGPTEQAAAGDCVSAATCARLETSAAPCASPYRSLHQ